MHATTKEKRPPLPTPSTAAAVVVASNDDLLVEILLRLPTKPLARAKSVSKYWLSLISSPYFSLCKNPNPRSPSALIVQRSPKKFDNVFSNIVPKPYYVPVDGGENQASSSDPRLSALDLFNENPDFVILQSCNGLFCCCDSKVLNYYVVNPAIKQFRNLDMPDLGKPHLKCFGVSLAFDPSKSPHYKVVCVRDPGFSTFRDQYYQIEIYCSQSSTWRPSGDVFMSPDCTQFSRGVFWNGAINWLSTFGDSLYFNVDQESLRSMPMPMPPMPRKVRYYGESGGHLHLVEFDDPKYVSDIKIYEMERDYSGWFVRYSVALNEVPEMIVDNRSYMFSILCIVRKENEDESFLVLHIPGKVISYNLTGKTFKQIFDLAPNSVGDEIGDRIVQFGWFSAYPYIDNISSV